ncbi:MAG: Integrins alpha chain [Clostridiales bacterium]|jgi:hypothetical protein|nr:Integrins alpha chain [Clostridiales bacterium]
MQTIAKTNTNNYSGNFTNDYEITCISINRVIDSRYKKVRKEFIFELPFYNSLDCSTVDCNPLPGTEKIIYQDIKPTWQPGAYSVYLKIAKSFAFTIHCPTGDKSFTKELIFSLFCYLTLPGEGSFDLQVKTCTDYCYCTITPGENFIQIKGKQPGDQFGFAVATDNNPASIDVGSPSAAFGSIEDAGRVAAFSYPNLNKLFEAYGSAPEDDLGFSLATGCDLNGDGLNDILAGAPSAKIGTALRAGYIRVLSGLDGTTLLEIKNTEPEAQFGWSVSWAGDLDGDGVPDILVGAPLASPGGKVTAGSVFVYSGTSGSLLYRLDGQNPDDSFGYSVKKIADIDGDGIPDFVVGAPFASPSGIYQAGIVYVYSGASGNLIYSIQGTEKNAGLGFSIDSLDDINGDGIPEIVVGAPNSSPGGRKEAGSAYIFSGKDGSQLLHFAGPVSGEEVGVSVSSAGDFDNDGLPDLALGAPSASPNNERFAGKVYIVSSKSGNIWGVLAGEKTWAQFGWSVTGGENLGLSKSVYIGSPDGNTLGIFKTSGTNKLKCEINLTAVISVLQKADILIPTVACSSNTCK